MSKFRRARKGRFVTDYKTACYLRNQWEYNLQRIFVVELVGGPFSECWRARPATPSETLSLIAMAQKGVSMEKKS